MKLKSKLLFFIVLFLIACQTQDKNFNKLSHFVERITGNNKIDNYKYVFVITDIGCSGCNSIFARMALNHIKDDSALFLISAGGNVFDISCFVNKKRDNVYIISNEDFIKLPLLKKSGVIFVKENNIDTIYEVKYKNLKNDLKKIENIIK